MTKQIINVGTTDLAGDGESIRNAFVKVNANFDELYDREVNTDAQTLSLEDNTLSISGGNSVDLSEYSKFSGSYNDLSDTPEIPSDVSDLTDAEGLLDSIAVNSISNGTTKINIPDEDGDIEIDGDVKLYGGLAIHSAGEPLGINDIVFFDGGLESGRITSQGETGGAIQVQAEVNFEVKVNQDDGQGAVETALWTFSSNGELKLPEGGDIVDSNGVSVLGAGGSADTGDITFTGTTISTADDEQPIEIQTRDDAGEWNTRIRMDPEDVYIRLSARRGDDREFGTFDWSTATWLNDGGGNRIIFTNAASLIEFFDSNLWSNGGNKQLNINDGERFDFNGTSINRSDEIVTLPIGSGGPTDTDTVSNIRFFWINESQIQLDQYDDERLRIDGNGIDMRVNITDGIEFRSGDDIDLRADDDFDIRADDRVRITGDRVRIRSRSSEDTVDIITNLNDEPKTWEFRADGSLKLPGNGDYTIGETEPGLYLSSNFGVAIFTDAAEAGKAFIFGPDGELTLPSGGIIREGMVGTNQTVDIIPGDSELEDQRLIVKGGFLPGQEPHIHLTMGNLTEGSIFLGTDEHNVRTMTNGGMSISARNYSGEISKTWEFSTDGITYLPGATVQEAVSATYDDEPVVLDLTKSIHKLANGEYTLLDGVEGQIIYLVPQTGATPLGVELYITHARVVSNSHSQVVNNGLFLPFSGSVNNNLRNVITLIFTDSAWNLSGGEWD